MRVVLWEHVGLSYPVEPPYSPHELYPESLFTHLAESENLLYPTVRKMFWRLGYDKENFGKETWNPLGKFITPGQKVVVKPNWVLHRNMGTGSLDGLITHPALVRVVVDYLVIALKGEGTIILGDAPIQSADFSAIVQGGYLDTLKSLVEENSAVSLVIEDFRREITVRSLAGKVTEHHWRDDGDFVPVNLEHNSFLDPITKDYQGFRVTNYDKNKMLKYHSEHDHIYVIHKSVLSADAVIALPKLKSHRKAGLTCCLKNSVGVNCQKDCLPHHRRHSLAENGDAYQDTSFLKRCKEYLYEGFDQTHSPSAQSFYHFGLRIVERLLKALSVNDDFEGSWYGNNTVWRTILDINKILFLADSAGRLHQVPQRKLFYLVDGIIAGEGEGPLESDDRPFGLLAAGENPLAVDLVMAWVVGFDYTKIPTLARAVEDSFLWPKGRSVADLPVLMSRGEESSLGKIDLNLQLEPTSGWKGHIERDPYR
jgi:uncharacterized protein (DUF362 family)